MTYDQSFGGIIKKIKIKLTKKDTHKLTRVKRWEEASKDTSLNLGVKPLKKPDVSSTSYSIIPIAKADFSKTIINYFETMMATKQVIYFTTTVNKVHATARFKLQYSDNTFADTLIIAVAPGELNQALASKEKRNAFIKSLYAREISQTHIARFLLVSQSLVSNVINS